MKTPFILISTVVLTAILALVAVEANNIPWSGKQPEANATISTDDAGIQKCISEKLAAAPSLKSQGFTVSVSGGVATLTGNAKNAGSKGSATMIAKRCGAQSVVN